MSSVDCQHIRSAAASLEAASSSLFYPGTVLGFRLFEFPLTELKTNTLLKKTNSSTKGPRPGFSHQATATLGAAEASRRHNTGSLSPPNLIPPRSKAKREQSRRKGSCSEPAPVLFSVHGLSEETVLRRHERPGRKKKRFQQNLQKRCRRRCSVNRSSGRDETQTVRGE